MDDLEAEAKRLRAATKKLSEAAQEAGEQLDAIRRVLLAGDMTFEEKLDDIGVIVGPE